MIGHLNLHGTNEPVRDLLRRADAREYLARVARYLLAQRETLLPAEVAAGRITPLQRDAKLDAARALAAQWNWATDLAAPPPPDMGERGLFGAWNFEIAIDLADAAERAADRAARRPGDDQAAAMAVAVEALAWLQRLDGDRYNSRIVAAVAAERRDSRYHKPVQEAA